MIYFQTNHNRHCHMRYKARDIFLSCDNVSFSHSEDDFEDSFRVLLLCNLFFWLCFFFILFYSMRSWLNTWIRRKQGWRIRWWWILFILCATAFCSSLRSGNNIFYIWHCVWYYHHPELCVCQFFIVSICMLCFVCCAVCVFADEEICGVSAA